jgi:hypothetical protein
VAQLVAKDAVARAAVLPSFPGDGSSGMVGALAQPAKSRLKNPLETLKKPLFEPYWTLSGWCHSVGTWQVGGAAQMRTLAGCTCQLVWENRGQQFLGVCGNPDNDPNGDWCDTLPSPRRAANHHTSTGRPKMALEK